MARCRRLAAVLVYAGLLTALPADAQDPPPSQVPSPASPIPTQIELNLINLPTTLSIRNHHSYFRLTHRFERDLRRGDFSELASELFSLDSGAIIGFEYRFGVTPTLQAGIHRSMLSKTIQTFARWDALHQGDRMPVSISLTGSFEGLNNLQQDYQSAVAVTLSRVFGNVAAVYATPAFVSGTRGVDLIEGPDDDTWFAGLGARVRIRPTVYIVAEATPRLAGYDPGRAEWGVAIEKRTGTGGHTLQLNFTNSFGTTFGQLARGGSEHDIYLGFNITRKF